MRIDERVEHLVRDALDAAVKRDADRLESAMSAFPDQNTRVEGLRLLVAISSVVLVDAYQGTPTAGQIDALAEKISRMEAWVDLTAGEAGAYLHAVADGTPLVEAIPSEDAAPLAFVVTASLLASRPLDDGQWWFDYLDRVEATIEASA